MGVSYKLASSTLLCPEDSNSVLGFDEEQEAADLDGEVERRDLCHFPGKRIGLYGGFLMDFTLQSEDCIALLIEKEMQHLPPEDYAERLLRGQLGLDVRNDAIDWIQKVHAHYNFGPLSAYLSVNYLDRFLSSYELPQGKAWMKQLLSVACLSLAAKVEETEVPLSLDLQVGEAKYVFEARTIQRMELLVLSTLKWRMQSVTPFSFIDYFLHQFNGGNPPDSLLISLSVDLILGTVRGIDFLEFRPSEIAAAVAISALKETPIVEIDNVLSYCIHVNKEKVLRCHELIEDMSLMKKKTNKKTSTSFTSVPRSPNGILDAACVSYKSDDTTLGSHANSHHSSPAAKRRKVNSSLG
ncbi:hypothetical protein Cni_G11491 [Canna indica]|uniref:Cyclin N-terminal domain-containing protein n=1 Tax=Canna indica TaxID=4628 RepID=A0AAQ3K6F8_9LILI|nr:hypothetical protein Cni_G11491 [Canna indica]